MIEPQPTWEIKDSSKLSTFTDCRRWLFYEHILGWKVDSPSHDTYFGESWHKSREHMLLHGYDDVEGAFQAFMRHYRKEFDEDTDELYVPKTPEAVFNALALFSVRYRSDLIENELLYTEISGTVPVDEKRSLHYRMDSILRNKETGMIFSWDHKSTSEKNINGRYWENAFYLSIQGGTYTHCLYCMFPIEEVKGVEFCGAGFHYLSRGSAARPAGYHCTFKRVPAWKTKDQMNVWLWNTLDKLDDWEREMDRLSHCREGDRVMQAFPMNENSCNKYWGCPFHAFCLGWSNPLQHCFEPPPGFKVEFWDPSAMETTHKKDLKWGGE